jgi:DNA-binding PadR family transcriptional regulator
MHTQYVTVRNGLLALLGEGPTYGFQLKTHFEDATGKTWDLNVGQVYTTLDRLERDGLVEVHVDDGQKRYELTTAGDDALERWWASVPGDEPPPRDELLLKVMLALPYGRDHALDVVTHQRTALLELLARRQRDAVERRRDNGSTGPVAALAADLMADALVMRLEADVRWLDRCEARLLDADDSAFSLRSSDDDGTDLHDDPAPPPTNWRTRSAPTKATRR